VDAYDWSISRQGTERFLQFRASERRKLLDHFDQIAANVHLEPVASFTASDGKEFYISTLAKYVITYHIDHAVKMISIIAIE
jgi:hypothetical protein